MWLYIWLSVTIFALIVEFLTSEFVSVWFAGGGLVGIILSATGLPWYIHVPAFVVVSTVLLLLFRKLVITRFNKGGYKLNADSLLGTQTKLEEGVSFGNPGSVRIKGVVWTAVAKDDMTVIEKDKIVVIKEIKGNKLIVEEVNL